MRWEDFLPTLVLRAVTLVVGLVVRWFRAVTAKPTENLLRPEAGADLRLVFSSVPREPTAPEELLHPEFNYLAGPNEVDFAWRLYPFIKRLVPIGKTMHPIAFSKEMYIGGGTVKTANQAMWTANLIVSGSTKFNDVTRELHSRSSGLPLQIVFPPEGGAILDKNHERRYTADRSNGEVISDYGIFAKYWNPYDKGRTIFLIAGIESVFQIGITQTLIGTRSAQRFLAQLQRTLGGEFPNYYECLVRAPGSGLAFTGPLEIVEAYPLEAP